MTDTYYKVEFLGQVLHLSEAQYQQALLDSRLCRCNTCLCCAIRKQNEAQK